MGLSNHLKKMFGYPRREAVTRADVKTADAPPEAIGGLIRAQKETAKLIEKLDDTRRLARSVEHELAAEALRIVQHRA